jgi:transposase
MTILVDDLVPEELWALVEPLLPAPPRPPYGGRHRTVPDRNCFAAIVYMVRTSTPWRLLPARELGCGSPATCWRRLNEWAQAGVFDQLHLAVLDRLGEQGRLDWSRASVDTMSVRAKRGGPCGRKSRRSWQARKQASPGLRRRRTAADRGGPEDVPPIRTPSGRRRRRPAKVDADKGYDSAANRAWLRRRGISARIARRGIESSTRLGRHRWRVERALSWLSCWRRLGVRWDRDSGRWLAFVLVACALTCGNRLQVRPEDHWWAAGPPVAVDAACDGRSHSATRVGCIVSSTTASSSPVNASRSTCWRSRALNASMVRAAS